MTNRLSRLCFCLMAQALHVTHGFLVLQHHALHVKALYDFGRSSWYTNACRRQRLSSVSKRAYIHRFGASTALYLSEEQQTDNEQEANGNRVAAGLGLLAQPMVWASLVNVKLTGSGLPSGPFGIIGAIEGISYLVLLGWAVSAGIARFESRDARLVESLSAGTIALGILVLLSLVVDKGCVPNAKPILDYSDYLPVCEASVGLFGG